MNGAPSSAGAMHRALLLLPILWAALPGAHAESLRGPAFTDPDYEISMPPEWVAKPVRRDGWAAGADLAVTLDQHLYPALLPLIQEYARTHGLDIAVQEGTCGISAGKLEDKSADIGGFCCPAGYTDRLPGLRFHTLGVAALALLVHPDNPVTDVTLDQARGLFQGRLNRWSEVAGGNDERVRAVGRLHCKARPGHWRLILDSEDQFGPLLHEVSTIPDMIAAVSGQRGTLGYETLWMVGRHRGASGRVKTLAVDGVVPEDDGQVVSGDYPLYRTYNLTTWEGAAAEPQAAALVAHLQENLERIDPRYGIIPARRLREAGWRFRGDELVGEPGTLATPEPAAGWRAEMALRLSRFQGPLCGMPAGLAQR